MMTVSEERYYQDVDRLAREMAQKMVDGDTYPSANLGKAVPVEWATSNQSLGGMSSAGSSPTTGTPLSERLTLQNIDDAMNYQPWQRDQQDAGQIVKEALTLAAKAILRSVPDSPFRTVALRNIIDARMNANAAISFRGRF